MPKQYAVLKSKPVLRWSLDLFASHQAIAAVQVVIQPDDRALYDAAVAGVGKVLAPVAGGATRQASVLAGLRALADAAKPERVLIHDAARPFATSGTIDRLLSALDRGQGAIAAQPLADTLKRTSPDGLVEATIAREGLWRAQTPQAFDFDAILAAHERAAAQGLTSFTDDAAVAEWAGLEVAVVDGGARNVKITTAEDLAMAETVMAGKTAMAAEFRTGNGFDVHKFAAGDGVWLCGIKLPHSARLEGHSDADVAWHALTDALLGAIGAGDIGQHFPPSDAKWKDASSEIFLAHAVALVAARGGRIINTDVTILAEAPKVGPYREQMRQRTAAVLGIEVERVGVKATTTEGLGFTGRREGIAAMATASVALTPPA